MPDSAPPLVPLRIAHINSEIGFSGGEAQMFLLMNGLRERGHHNILIGRRGSRCLERGAAAGFEVHEVSMRNDLDVRGWIGLRRALRRAQPAIVNQHTGRAGWLGGWAAWSLGLPSVVIRRMDRTVRPGLRSRLTYGKFSETVVAVSPAVVDCLVAGGVPRQRVHLICDAVDPDQLKPRRSAQEVRKSEGLAANRPLLLTLASLDRRKGIDVLLEALARVELAPERPQPMLWIAGDGPERADLEERLQRLGLTDRARLLGRREDARDLLNACDFFVLPSRREGLGVAALEAMAVGKAVVASRVGGLAHAVRDRETGLLVPAEDPTALARALSELLEDDALRHRLGAAGPKHIEAHFLGSVQVKQYEALYQQLLS